MRDRSVLMTEDPFHIPGYGGYVPQLAYKCGRVYGPATHEILLDRSVGMSGNSVLAHIDPSGIEKDRQMEQLRQQLVENRTSSWGDQRFRHPAVPGYTGEIPRYRDYSGKTFAQTALNAVADFELEQKRKKALNDELQTINCLQSGKLLPNRLSHHKTMPKLLTKYHMPLKPIASDMKPYHPKSLKDYNSSVYRMDNGDPMKKFITGYMGFVPRQQGMHGRNQEIATHDALNEFTDELKKHKMVLSTPVQVDRPKDVQKQLYEIYPREYGMVPRYTGHIPGGKYQFGKTYWEATLNAKKKFDPMRSKWSSQVKSIIL